MEKKIRRPSRILFVLMCLITAVVIAVNTFLWGFASPYFGFLNNIMNAKSVTTTEAAMAASKTASEVTQEVEEEGIILLKNSASVLPLTEKKVNVFGAGSVNFTYGGSGSGAGDESKNVTFYQGLENAGFETNAELKAFYEDNVHTTGGAEMIGYIGSDFNIYEPEKSLFTDRLARDAGISLPVIVSAFTTRGNPR